MTTSVQRHPHGIGVRVGAWILGAFAEGLGYMIEDALATARLFGGIFKDAKGEVRKALIHGAIYLLMFLPIYMGYFIVQNKGDVLAGLQAAFTSSPDLQRAAVERERQAVLQYELKTSTYSDKLISQVLETVRVNAPGAARVEMAQIHNGVSGTTGIGLLRYDMTNAVASSGRAPGEASTNNPLSNWIDFTATLLTGDCALVHVSDMASAPARAVWQEMNVMAFLACPVIDVQRLTLGAVFVSWDNGDALPDKAAMAHVIEHTREAGERLGTALDLRRVPSE